MLEITCSYEVVACIWKLSSEVVARKLNSAPILQDRKVERYSKDPATRDQYHYDLCNTGFRNL